MPGENSNSSNGNQVKYLLGGILIGAAVGSAVALLYAPMKGEDTRRFLKEKAIQGQEFASEKANQVKEMASAAKNRGSEILDCVKGQGA